MNTVAMTVMMTAVHAAGMKIQGTAEAAATMMMIMVRAEAEAEDMMMMMMTDADTAVVDGSVILKVIQKQLSVDGAHLRIAVAVMMTMIIIVHVVVAVAVAVVMTTMMMAADKDAEDGLATQEVMPKQHVAVGAHQVAEDMMMTGVQTVEVVVEIAEVNIAEVAIAAVDTGEEMMEKDAAGSVTQEAMLKQHVAAGRAGMMMTVAVIAEVVETAEAVVEIVAETRKEMVADGLEIDVDMRRQHVAVGETETNINANKKGTFTHVPFSL